MSIITRHPCSEWSPRILLHYWVCESRHFGNFSSIQKGLWRTNPEIPPAYLHWGSTHIKIQHIRLVCVCVFLSRTLIWNNLKIVSKYSVHACEIWRAVMCFRRRSASVKSEQQNLLGWPVLSHYDGLKRSSTVSYLGGWNGQCSAGPQSCRCSCTMSCSLADLSGPVSLLPARVHSHTALILPALMLWRNCATTLGSFTTQ